MKALITVKLVIRSIVPLSIVALSGAAASAHPGHGHPGPAHHVAEPQHGAVLLMAMLAGIAIVILCSRVMPFARDNQSKG